MKWKRSVLDINVKEQIQKMIRFGINNYNAIRNEQYLRNKCPTKTSLSSLHKK